MTSDAVRRLQRALAEEEERLVGESASRERARRAEADRLIRSKLVPVPPEVTAADPSRHVDEFVLVEELGRGGGGEVWKAWDRNLARWVALKRPAPGVDRRRFLQEALAAARLSHSAIVPVHRVVEGDPPYLVMDRVEGRNLAGMTLEPAEAARVMAEVARAVAYAHSQGVVHRDLKPANLMLDHGGAPRILDFGIAGPRPVGEISGTPEFMAPEQAEGGGAASAPAVDVYALGATLKALCGRRLTGHLAGVAERAMRKDPAARTRTAEQFARELSVARRRPWLLIATAAILVPLGGFLVYAQLNPAVLGRGDSAGRDFMRLVDRALDSSVRNWSHLDALEKLASDELAKRPAAELHRIGRGRIRAARLLEGRSSNWSEGDADLALIPDHLPWREGRGARAQLLAAWAGSESRAGRDPGDRFDRAEHDANAGLEGANPHPDAWAIRGRIRQLKMEHLLRSRLDPGALAADARRDFDEAIRRGVRDRGEVLLLMAGLSYTLADLEAEKGGDPLEGYATAERDYTEAASVLSPPARALLMRGCVRYNSAVHLKRAGRVDDAKQKAAEALADFDEATTKDSSLAEQARDYAEAARRIAEE